MDPLECAAGKLALALRATASEVRTQIPAESHTTFLTQLAARLDAAAADLELVLAVMSHAYERQTPLRRKETAEKVP